MQIFSSDKAVQDNLRKSRVYEWVDGEIEKGILHDRFGKAGLPESGYIQTFDFLRGIPLETGEEPHKIFGDDATFFIDKECDATAMLRSPINELETFVIDSSRENFALSSCSDGIHRYYYEPMSFGFRTVSSL